MKTTGFTLLLMIATFPAWAGFGDKPPIRWGKVNMAEFTMLPREGDTSAPALVLCDYGRIEMANRTFYTRHIRIRILKPEGLSYAAIEIPYQTKNRHDDFISLQAQTLVLENGKIVSYPVTAGHIADSRIDESWSMKKFTFPRVTPGVIIEYTYKVASLDFEKLDSWYFQREIPTVWSEMRFDVPDPFIYLVTFRNNRQLVADEELRFGERLQWLYNEKPRARIQELGRNNYLLFSTQEQRYKVWVLTRMKKKIVMRNLPGLSAGVDGQPVSAFYPQVSFDLFESSGNLPRAFRPLVLTTHPGYEMRGEWSLMHDATAIPGYVHFRLDTWSEYNDALLQHERFGGYLVKNPAGTSMLDSIVRGNTNPLVKMELLLQYVRKSFSWNGKFAQYAGQDFRDFLASRSGSSAEINLVLVNLLRAAGIDAHPLLIRTSDRGLPEKMYPVKDQFNHVIAVAEIAGDQILLDAVSGTGDLTRLHKLDIGTYGWIVREENPGWIEIYTPEDADEAPVFRL